jgi:membrane associated rhomboid family serine protease
MIIPYSTDAPIYHFPKATLGVAGINVAVHLAWALTSPEAAEPYALKLGAGLHPLQWLTHNFLHADLLHLLGNMWFLWSYGILVEGKVGWLPFLLCYLGIGTAHGAAIQAAYLHAAEPSYVLGASGIIFGLMAMCMVWAPVNEISIFYVFLVGFRVISNTFELPIYGFALLELGFEGISVVLTYLVRGDPMSSGLLHISGAFWGLVAGVVLLKSGWVNCEGWDVFSLLRKRRALREAWEARGMRQERTRANERLPKSMRAEEDRPGVTPEERAARRLAKVHRAIDSGDADAAQAAFGKWMDAVAGQPSREDLLKIVKALHARGDWVASVAPLRALCRLHPDGSERARLKLASVLVRELQRPAEARRHLLQLPAARLDAAGRRVHRMLLEEADRMIDAGVLELDEEG